MSSSDGSNEIRIAIGGRYLDEVCIRQTPQFAQRSLSYLCFPASRHWARVDGERVTISAQAATVVQLFADAVLPPVGACTVVLEIGGRSLGPCRLESVESGETSAVDDMIVLRFRRTPEVTT